MSYVLPDSPKPFQTFKDVLHIFLIHAPNTMHTIVAFARSIVISPDRKVSLNSLTISEKMASCDTLVISRIDSRHDDHCK